MAVEKFRSGEEMNAAPAPIARGGGFDRFVRHCARYRTLAPRLYPRGVLKFRSLEEAQRARAEIAKANVRRNPNRTASPE
jgi:hypothetical protein